VSLRRCWIVVLLSGIGCGGATDVPVRQVTHDTTITVLARRRNGDVVPGAHVLLFRDWNSKTDDYNWKDSAVTGADGRYTFRHLALGLYGLRATAPDGYAVTPQISCPPPLHPEIRCVIPTELYGTDLAPAIDAVVLTPLILYKRGSGTIVVHVTGEDGKPLAGAKVNPYGALTDAAGNALFTAGFGTNSISVDRPYLYRDFLKALDSLTKPVASIDVEEGTRDSAAVVLAKCAGTVRVTAVDDAGQPARNVITRLMNASSVLANRVTDAQGEVNDFPEIPCAVPHAVVMVPMGGSGYVPAVNEYANYLTKVDLYVTNGARLPLSFRLLRTP
jgi:hypothetical protein